MSGLPRNAGKYRAEDTDSFAAEVETDEALEGEVETADPVRCLVDAPVKRHQERHGELSHSRGRVGGNASDTAQQQ